MGRLWRLIVLIARYGVRIGRRIFQLEELLATLTIRLRVLMRLADAEADIAIKARRLTQAREVEEQLQDTTRRIRRLENGNPE